VHLSGDLDRLAPQRRVGHGRGLSLRGFFIWAPLLAERMHRLTAWDRKDFTHRIRAFRAMGYEAWLATTDGTTTGPLTIGTRQPD
jgi:hypothetical protein